MKTSLESELEKIREALKMDGGDVELVSFENGVVTLRFQGACVGCPLSAVTFSQYIEKQLKTTLPDVQEVQIV